MVARAERAGRHRLNARVLKTLYAIGMVARRFRLGGRGKGGAE
jgi:hypothetical protein